MPLRLSPDARNARATAALSLIDAGSGAGTVDVYEGAQPVSPVDAPTGSTLLVTLTLSAQAFADPVAGVAEMNAVATVAAAVSGLAQWCRFRDSDGVAVIDGHVTGVSGGGVLRLTNPELVATEDVVVASGVWTEPA